MHGGATLSLNYEIIPLFKSALALVSEVARSGADLMDFLGLARRDRRPTVLLRQASENHRLLKGLGPRGAV